MITNEETWLRVTIALLNLMSMLGCCVIIWTVYCTPRMIQNPGSIIMRIAICQTILSFLIFFSQFYQGPQDSNDKAAFEISSPFCQSLGFIEIWIAAMYIFYNVYFILNLYLSLKMKDYHFQFYLHLMEVITQVLSCIIALVALLQKEIGIGVLGLCSFSTDDSAVILTTFMLVILSISGVVVLYIGLEKGTNFTASIYTSDPVKFKAKYQEQFIKLNILYSVVFLSTHLLPQLFLLMWWLITSIAVKQVARAFLLLFTSIAGILLFVIRIRDPLVYKFLRKQLKWKKEIKLKDKLLVKTISTTEIIGQVQKNQDMEFAYYSGNNLKTIQTQEQIISSQALQSGSIQSYPPKLGLKKQKSLMSCILKNKLELIQLIMTIKKVLSKEQNPAEHFKPFQPYNFLHMQSYQVNIKHSSLDFDNLIANGQINHYQLEDYLSETLEGSHKTINCFSYAQKIFQNWLYQYLGIDMQQVLQSLNLANNIKKIISSDNLNLSIIGSSFITDDTRLIIDLITTRQKTLLTRTDALLNICKRWYDQSQADDVCDGGTLLPAILGIFSIQFDENRCVNCVLRINMARVDYPLQVWEESKFEQLMRNNVIGCIQVSANGIQKNFLGAQIFDGKYKIKIEESDFRLSSTAQNNLLQVLKRDLPSYNITNNLVLTFIYFKLTTKRLESLVQKEEKRQPIQELIIGSNKKNKLDYLNTIGMFDLDSKIGYVRVFFDGMWNEQYEPLSDEEKNRIYERLIENLTEII